MTGKYITDLTNDELYELFYKHRDENSDLYRLTQTIQEICQVTISKSLQGNLIEVIQAYVDNTLIQLKGEIK